MRAVFLRHLRTRVLDGILMIRTKRQDDAGHRYGPGLVMECGREDRARGLWRDVSCMS